MTWPLPKQKLFLRCAWIMDRGYHNGYQCGNGAKYVYRLKGYCAVHIGLAQDPQRLAQQPAQAGSQGGGA